MASEAVAVTDSDQMQIDLAGDPANDLSSKPAHIDVCNYITGNDKSIACVGLETVCVPAGRELGELRRGLNIHPL